jgi:hypothetical protein
VTGQPSPTESDSDGLGLVEAPDWPDGFLALFHEVWGDAKVGKPYDRQQKHKFARLLCGLERLQRQTRHWPVESRRG